MNGKEALRLGRATFSKPSERTLALVCSQLAIVLSSGLPLSGALRLVAEANGTGSMRKLLERAAEQIAAGSTLAAALEEPGTLPPILTETVRSGEESGTLAAAFRGLGSYFERRTRMKNKAASALTYPALVAVAAVIVMAVILVRLVPSLVGMFTGMGAELPLATRVLIGLSRWMTRYWPWLLLGLALLGLALLLCSTGERGRLFLSRLRLPLPLVGKLEQLQDASRFASAMSMLLGGGMTVTRGLEIASRTMSNGVLHRTAADCVLGIREGRELSDCLRQSKRFPPLLCELVRVGEETRSLADTFGLAAQTLEEELNRRTDRMLRYLEPATILVVAAFALFLLMAVYTPMLSLYSGIA